MNVVEDLKDRYPSLTPEKLAQILDILDHKIVVRLEKPAYGYWDGGAKSHFEFNPSLRHYSDGTFNIQWGSWGANWWFRVELGKSTGRHYGTVKRKLFRGSPGRTITVEER